MQTMSKFYKNGQVLKKAFRLIYGTGKGLGIAANTGFKAGYFVAKHPKIEQAGTRIQQNIKPYMLATVGVILGFTAFMMMKNKAQV